MSVPIQHENKNFLEASVGKGQTQEQNLDMVTLFLKGD